MLTIERFIGRVLQDTYRINRQIGKGGMGVVFEASHLRVARRFAVKLLFPQGSLSSQHFERFQREAQVTSALGHPHILEVIDFNYTSEGVPYIVMELLDGEDLSQRLARVGKLSLAEAATIFRQAASALQAAHNQAVIHRDLKPQNIFLSRRGERDDYVKIVDFGISKVMGADSSLTQTDAMMGSPLYMAPEQAKRKAGQVDQRADVWAMGAILFEMLVGKAPFRGESMLDVLYAIVNEEAPRLRSLRPDLPRAVENVVVRALQKAPMQRFESMAAFWKALAAPLKDAAITLYEPTEDRKEDWITMQDVVDGEPTDKGVLDWATDDTEPQKDVTGHHASAPEKMLPPLEAHPSLVPTHAEHGVRDTPEPPKPDADDAASAAERGGFAPSPPYTVTEPARYSRSRAVVVTAALLVVAGAVGAALALHFRDRSGAPSAAKDLSAAAADAGLAAAAHDAARSVAAVDAALADTPADAEPTSIADAAAQGSAKDAAPSVALTRLLWVASRPTKAEVRIADRLLGTTPFQGVAIPRDEVTLRLRKRGYWEREVSISAGDGVVRLPLVKLSKKRRAPSGARPGRRPDAGPDPGKPPPKKGWIIQPKIE